MIKKSTIIRNLNEKQIKQLQEVQERNKIKSTSKTFLFVLDNYLDQQKDIERLKRIIDLKQKKIDNLKSENDASI
ncbi:hypothetical protein ACI6PS_03495 [Flavobacterium sp. PLA-1-15]|uniref:hypothetical protein n=1 Tax=Flavobacterium sp. PLA-1-15 TaxID=3380533 RepID=UPI003B802DC2